MTEPNITVLMPAYNAEKYIGEAIESILNQTYAHFIFLIINDGSTDGTEAIILSYKDARIKYVKNEANIGLTATLNNGISLTETKYLARMDADDISLPERFQLQYDFMEANEQVGVCSTWYHIFGTTSNEIKLDMEYAEMKANILFGTTICHPTVMLRTDLLKKNNITYGVPFEFSDGLGRKVLELEDVALWNKLKHITQFAIIKQVLLKYRWEGQNLTTKRLDLILERKKEYYKYLLSEINIVPNDTNLMLHINLKHITNSTSLKDINSFKEYLNEIVINNQKIKIYDNQSLQKVINEKWNNFFYFLPETNYKMVFRYAKISNGLNKKQLSYLIKFSINKFTPKSKRKS